jgi:hypothetical protein
MRRLWNHLKTLYAQCSHPLAKVGFVLASLLVGLLAIKLLLILGFLAAYAVVGAFMALLMAVWALVHLILYFWKPLLLILAGVTSARGIAAMRTARAATTRATT